MMPVCLSVTQSVLARVLVSALLIAALFSMQVYAQGMPVAIEQGSQAPKAWWDAVNAGNVTAMNKLATQGDYVNARDEEGVSAILITVNLGHTAATDWLVAHKADVTVQTYNGYNVLFAACSQGNARLAKLALDAGVTVNEYCQEVNMYNGKVTSRYTPAHLVAANGSIECMNCLFTFHALI